MNEHVTVYKSDVQEIHHYEKQEIPFIFHPDMTKKRGTIFLVNKHADIELLFVTKGKMEVHLDDAVFYAKEGDIVVANPNVLHNIIPLTDAVTYECLIIDKQFFDRHGLFLDKIKIQEMICDETIQELIHLIKSTLSAPQATYYIARINFYLLHLALLLFEKHGVEKTDGHKNSHHLLAIEKGIRYLDKHFTEQISVEDIAEYVGYSSSHLRHCFKEITGYTFTTYLNMQRIKYARTLLQSSDMSIEEIALLSGFHSPTYFSSTYKKYTGVSPSNEKQLETCAARRTII